MSGAGSAAIFDVELEPSPFSVPDDEFGEAAKPTVEPMFKIKDSELLGNNIKMNNVNLNRVESAVNIDELIDISNVKIPETSKQTNLMIPLFSRIPIEQQN